MTWFNAAINKDNSNTATVEIMDQIGKDWWTEKGTEATDFIQAVRELGEVEKVDLYINSPGS